MRILIVEDDIRLAQAVGEILSENDYLVDMAYDGITGLSKAQANEYDVIILDIMLPHMDGFAIAKELRAGGNMTPLLMLTARTQIEDKLTGIDAGANDYMTKPFAPSELLAHLRSLTNPSEDTTFETLSFGDVSLDLESHDLKHASKSINLSFKEFSILNTLMAEPNHAALQETLWLKAWGNEHAADTEALEAYLTFLSRKLAFLGSEVRIEEAVSSSKRAYQLVM